MCVVRSGRVSGVGRAMRGMCPRPTPGHICRACHVWVVGELVRFGAVVVQVPYRTWRTRVFDSRPMWDHTKVIKIDVLDVFSKIP